MKVRITIFTDYNVHSETGTVARLVEKEYSSFGKAKAAATRIWNKMEKDYCHGKGPCPEASHVEAIG